MKKLIVQWRKLHRIRREVFVLAAIAVVLCLIYTAVWLGEDRVPHVFHIPEERLEYVIGDSDDALLQGVTAEDNRDGDITNRIVIISTRLVTQQEMSVVYQVRDSSGNLTTVTRTCDYQVVEDIVPGEMDPTEPFPEESSSAETSTEAESSMEETEEGSTGESAENSTEESTEEATTEESTTEEVTTEESTTEEPTTEEPTTEAPEPVLESIEVVYVGPAPQEGYITSAADFAVHAIYSDGTVVKGVTGWGCAQVGKVLQEGANTFEVSYQDVKGSCIVNAAAVAQPPAVPGAPVLVMSKTEVHIKAGEYFHYNKCIESITDDKDSQKALFDRIRVTGWKQFSSSVPGVYVFEIYVLDSDKNQSNHEVLTVYVE